MNADPIGDAEIAIRTARLLLDRVQPRGAQEYSLLHAARRLADAIEALARTVKAARK